MEANITSENSLEIILFSTYYAKMLIKNWSCDSVGYTCLITVQFAQV